MGNHAEVSRRFGQDIGRIARQHAACGAGVEVDIVVANRHIADRPQLRAGVQQLRIDTLAGRDEGAILALQPCNQLSLAPDQIVLIGLDFEVHSQTLQHAVEDAPGNQDIFFHVLTSIEIASGAGTDGLAPLVTLPG